MHYITNTLNINNTHAYTTTHTPNNTHTHNTFQTLYYLAISTSNLYPHTQQTFRPHHSTHTTKYNTNKQTQTFNSQLHSLLNPKHNHSLTHSISQSINILTISHTSYSLHLTPHHLTSPQLNSLSNSVQPRGTPCHCLSHSLTHSLTHSLIDSLAEWLTDWLTEAITYTDCRPPFQQPNHQANRLANLCPFISSCTHRLTGAIRQSTDKQYTDRVEQHSISSHQFHSIHACMSDCIFGEFFSLLN